MRTKKVYLATQNGNGILPRFLFLDGQYVIGSGDTPDKLFWEYQPPVQLENFFGSWYGLNYYPRQSEARVAYIQSAKSRIEKAEQELEMVGA